MTKKNLPDVDHTVLVTFEGKEYEGHLAVMPPKLYDWWEIPEGEPFEKPLYWSLKGIQGKVRPDAIDSWRELE